MLHAAPQQGLLLTDRERISNADRVYGFMPNVLNSTFMVFFFFFSSAGIFEHLLGIAGLATRLRVWAEFVLQRARLITVVFIIWGKFFPEELLFVKS